MRLDGHRPYRLSNRMGQAAGTQRGRRIVARLRVNHRKRHHERPSDGASAQPLDRGDLQRVHGIVRDGVDHGGVRERQSSEEHVEVGVEQQGGERGVQDEQLLGNRSREHEHARLGVIQNERAAAVYR